MKKKICFVTGTRAEYGLLYNLIKKFYNDKEINTKIIVTGMHLSNEFGSTYKEILNDGFKIDKKVKLLNSSDLPAAVSKSTGLGVINFTNVFEKFRPDLLIVLGDRYEILSAVIAANFLKIPITHIGGGDTTLGAIDESIRHTISKMSWLHFVSTFESKKRVIQLGENPKRVFIVGSLGVERIFNSKLLDKINIEKELKFKFNKRNILITFHPVTLEHNTSALQFKEILSAISELKDTKLIFTYSNSDSNGRIIIKMIKKFVSSKLYDSVKFPSMGHINYLSVLKYCDCVLGNSSSGLIEAPSFNIGTLNIGDRQKGRQKAKSIIDCKPIKQSILKSLKKIYSKDFKKILLKNNNPYKIPNSSEKIYNIIKKQKIPKELKKTFYDL